MSEHHGTSLLLAFGCGLAAGAIAGLLLAPASGEETRRRVRDAADDLGGRAKEGLESATRTVKDQADRLKVALEEGRQAYAREGRPG